MACFHTLQIGMSWFPEQIGNGLDRVFYNLTRTLPEVEVGVSGLVAGKVSVKEGTDYSITSFAKDSSSLAVRLFAARKGVHQIFEGDKPDLVASHFALYTAPALDYVKRVPLVVHFHGPWAHESRVEGERETVVRIKKWVEISVYRRATNFIVLSDAFRDILYEEYDIPEEKVFIVPGGVHMEQFNCEMSRHEARAQIGWPQDRPIILSVRRLARRMGLDIMIDALSNIKKKIPDVLLCIAGKGPMEDEIRQRINAHNLQNHVRLLGFVPDDLLPVAYRSADVTVVPSVSLEGFGLITVESLASGTPVFVTPVGGLPEVVRDLSEDLIFPNCDSETIGERIVDALCNINELPSATECRSYAQAHFSWKVVAEKTRCVYEEVLR